MKYVKLIKKSNTNDFAMVNGFQRITLQHNFKPSSLDCSFQKSILHALQSDFSWQHQQKIVPSLLQSRRVASVIIED